MSLKISVRPRGDGHGWVVDYYWHGRRVRKTFQTKSKAAAYKSDVLFNVNHYGHPDPKIEGGVELTVADVVQRWVADLEHQNLRPRTLTSYISDGNVITKHLGHHSLHDLTRDQIEDWARILWDQGYSRKYPKKLVGALRQAIKWSGLDVDPTKLVRWPKEQPAEVRFYTVDQCKEILSVTPDRFLGVMAVLMFTGMRPAEAARLREQDIHREDKAILIPAHKGKTGRRYIEDAPDTVWKWLEVHKYDPTNYTRNIAQIARDVSFPWIQDGLRHTFATYMHTLTDAYKTAKCTGHRNPYTLHNHYLGVARKKEAEEFFNILPQEP